jgi:hypothetical protein
MAAGTDPMRVKHGTFLVERLAADAAPDQWKRELTENAIDAVIRALDAGLMEKGEVLWDVDWPLRENEGHFKLSILDNGDGMGDHELVHNINELSSSGGVQSLQDHYGVGAKITAGVNNPAGLEYVSVRPGGEARTVTFWKDELAGIYGLQQVEFDDGTFGFLSGVSDEYVPDLIREHGTAVTLWGTSENENTYLETAREAPYPTHHLVRYLNTRYFELDPRIVLRVREFSKLESPETWTPARQMAQGAQLRRVHGMRHFLDQYAEAKGQKDLGDAVAYWWILRDDKKIREQNDLWQATGHTAAIYQEELYEMKTANAARRMLQAFGVTFGSNRVVIYVEPRVEAGSITTDTARIRLIIDEGSAPWDAWAQRFSEDLPPEIEQLIANELAAANGKGEIEKIRERLKDVRKFFRLPRYRRVSNGTHQTKDDASGREPEAVTPRTRVKRNPRVRPVVPITVKAGTDPDASSRRLAEDGEQSKQMPGEDDDPRFVWVSLDGVNAKAHRDPGEMEDRAATYIRQSNLIKGNADFRGFTDLVEHFAQTYSGKPGARQVSHRVVYEWFEQLLIEAVLGARSLEGSQMWNVEDLDRAVSDEALTTAVAPRWHVYNSIKRTIGSQLGTAEAA